MDMKLRQRAEKRIETGTAPAGWGWHTGPQALTLLYELASEPKTASDALHLLHELQVHQVELDLQHEQAEEESRQLTADLAEYTTLFHLAPFAYLSLDPEGLVIAANRMAADWLAPGSGAVQEWAGRRIEDLLAPDCRAAVRAMFAALRNGEGRQTCAVRSRADGDNAYAVATATLCRGQVLMAFTPAEPAPGRAGR
jgi:hypothetical protein